jgi:hypothetical protein
MPTIEVGRLEDRWESTAFMLLLILILWAWSKKPVRWWFFDRLFPAYANRYRELEGARLMHENAMEELGDPAVVIRSGPLVGFVHQVRVGNEKKEVERKFYVTHADSLLEQPQVFEWDEAASLAKICEHVLRVTANGLNDKDVLYVEA